MRPAVLNAPRRLDVVEQPVPDPAAGELLLRVAGCGICATEPCAACGWSPRAALDDLFSHRFRLDEADRAFATAAEKPPGFVKATVTMED